MNSSSYALLCALLFSVFTLSSFVDREGDDLSTTIIVIDGKALLVDVDAKGTVVETYMEVPEYFATQKDHETKVLEAKASYTKLSKAQLDQIRFIAMVDEGWEMDEFMQTNLVDLAEHYAQTYANQIEVTIPTSKATEHLVAYNVQNIKSLLVRNGVEESDIIIRYKQDMSEDPTRFVKVVSNLKPLRSFAAK